MNKTNFLRKTSLNKEITFPRKVKSKSRMNKRADLEGLIKILTWIVFFGIALGALYFLIRRFTG